MNERKDLSMAAELQAKFARTRDYEARKQAKRILKSLLQNYVDGCLSPEELQKIREQYKCLLNQNYGLARVLYVAATHTKVYTKGRIPRSPRASDVQGLFGYDFKSRKIPF